MRTFLSISISLLSLTLVNAQGISEKKFWVGSTIGLNRTGLIGGQVVNLRSFETTYNVGGKFKYEMNNRFSLNGNLLYSGRKIDIDEDGYVDENHRISISLSL